MITAISRSFAKGDDGSKALFSVNILICPSGKNAGQDIFDLERFLVQLKNSEFLRLTPNMREKKGQGHTGIEITGSAITLSSE